MSAFCQSRATSCRRAAAPAAAQCRCCTTYCCCNACFGWGSAVTFYVRVACLYTVSSPTLVGFACSSRSTRRALCLLSCAAAFSVRARRRRGRWRRFWHGINFYLRPSTRRYMCPVRIASSRRPSTKACSTMYAKQCATYLHFH